ncbi:hypothetical protein L1049_022177 [Liquidambar formosana]|uniref:DC1 domain-containing protein n=1 Tax=Liquidambar formosana TaxID=63359 RepID=A0AAP0RDF3_LIQFO
MEIAHFSHQHRLILRDDKKNDEYKCYACQLPISSGPSYGCTQYKEFILHKSCVELPKRIEHPYHPQHFLILLDKSPYLKGYGCDACRKRCFKFQFVYHCDACDFDLDIGCASLVLPIMRYEGHEHLLTLFDKIHAVADECLCKSCSEPCSALVLRCVECNFNVHKSCADDKSCVELPKQIQHIFHPHQPLTPRDHPRKDLRCNACAVVIKNFSFRCEECDFTLGHECTSLAPTIKYEGHHHLLTLFHEFHFRFWCVSCEAWGHGFVFRCVECRFNLHPHCLPSFPRTIQHKCHETCPLTLTNSVPEDADTDEYYCDACEKQREESRYESVYYCADCSFVAHIQCVISEVLPLLHTEQEKIVWPKEAEFGDSSTVEGLLGAGAGDEVLEKGISAAVPSETVEVEVTAGREEFEAEITEDPVIAKLEGENAKLRAENEASTAKLEALTAKLGALTEKLEALTAKLEALESEHAQCVVSKRPSERDKCLSEA